MEFKEFKEKYFGKDIDYIKENLKKEENFFKKNISLVKLSMDAEECADSILELDKTLTPLYLFNQRYKIMLYIIQNLTNLELVPEDESFEDYDIFVDEAITSINNNALFFKNFVKDIINEKKYSVINELYSVFSTNAPSVEKIEEIQKSMRNIFADESPEKLKTIENILAFNDPTMVTIRDMIMAPVVNLKDKDVEEISNITNINTKKDEQRDELINGVKEIKNTVDKMTDKINNHPSVQEINNKILEDREKRVKEYSKELNEKINKQ